MFLRKSTNYTRQVKMTAPLVTESQDPVVDPAQSQPPTNKPEPEIVNAPTPPAPNFPSVDPRILGEVIRENTKLREELNRRNAAPPTPAPVREAKEFFDNPFGAVKQTVQEELATQIAPLHEFVKQFKAKDDLSTFRAKYAANPNYNLDKLGPVVDQLLQGQVVTEDSYRAAVMAANGMYNTGELAQYGIPYVAPTNNQPTTRVPINPGDTMRPAQLPPTPPQLPRKDNTPARTPLTESERINMNRFGLSEEDMYRVREGEDMGEMDIDALRTRFPKKETK